MERFAVIKVVTVLPKETKVGSGYRIDFSGDGVLRGQRQIPAKITLRVNLRTKLKINHLSHQVR